MVIEQHPINPVFLQDISDFTLQGSFDLPGYKASIFSQGIACKFARNSLKAKWNERTKSRRMSFLTPRDAKTRHVQPHLACVVMDHPALEAAGEMA